MLRSQYSSTLLSGLQSGLCPELVIATIHGRISHLFTQCNEFLCYDSQILRTRQRRLNFSVGYHLGGQVSKIRLSIAEYYVTRCFYLKVDEQLEFMGIFLLSERCSSVRARSHACSRLKLRLGTDSIRNKKILDYCTKVMFIQRLSVATWAYKDTF